MTTSGPRPLRLASSAESPTITSPIPITPNSAGPDNSKRNFRSNPHRQSSISYNRPSRDGPLSPALFSPRHATPILTLESSITDSRPSLSRSASVGSRATRNIDVRNGYSRTGPPTPITPSARGNRNSTESLLAEEKDRPPLTLVEKHADLLTFIAQKESKCLELRTQLNAHETELLQLKRKWERIVTRGFEKSQSDYNSAPLSASSGSLSLTDPPSASIYSAVSLSYLDSLSTSAQGAGGVAMLEALGGMKGIRDSVQQGMGRILDAVAGTNDGSSTKSHYRSLTHTPSMSSSSASTHTTSSTRLSQSSQSSFGDAVPVSISEEDSEAIQPVSSTRRVKKNRPSRIGIVSDTGATPLVSPTRDFAFEDMPHTATPMRSANGSMRARRKSRTFSVEREPSASASEESAGYADSDTNTSESFSSSLVDWNMGLSSPQSSRSTSELGNWNANKRMSLPARALSSAGAEGIGMSSWMGNMVGKRWEDTISKNQKRASVILSDVTQTISQNLPHSIIQALSPSAEVPGNRNSVSGSSSLMDEDIPPEESAGSLITLLEPSPIPPTKLALPLEPKPKSPMKKKAGPPAVLKAKTTKGSQEDDDDDWNW